MYQFQNVEPPGGTKLLDRGHEVGRVQTELGFFATAFFPAAEAPRRELDANACGRGDLHLLGNLKQDVDLAQLLEYDEDVVSELLTHERQPHELLVLVPVAHDNVIGRLG